MLPYIVSLISAYLAGSFPTAYVLVKWKSRLDIRQAGSGNVGTMNTFDVTGSKALSLGVLIVDVVKGALAVFLSGFFPGSDIWIAGAAGVGAVFGHNYPVWLRFRGGRGLATASGVFLMTGWVFVPLWLLLWKLVYHLTKDIHTANIAATMLALALTLVVPDAALLWCVGPESLVGFRAMTAVVCALIMIRHLDVLPAVLKSFRT